MSAPRPRRICITGAECTGKTTLARALAAALGAPWVPEFARAYAATCGHPLGPRDIQPIAEGVLRSVAAAATAPAAAAVLVLDTDLLSTVVYGEFYNGGCPGWIEHAARAERADLYLFCGIDAIVWEDDGIRGEARGRVVLDGLFRAALRRFDARVVELHGPPAARLHQALRASRSGQPLSN